jgi:hypothetical protein
MESDMPDKEGTREEAKAQALALVSDALEKMQFGAINLTVHNGRLVQIDVTQRQRFEPR